MTVRLSCAPLPDQLIALANGRSMPVGYSVRNEPTVPLTTVRLIAAAVASAGTFAATDKVTVPPWPRAWIGLAASRVSSTRTGAIGTSTEPSPELPMAWAANRPPPPNVMASAAPAAHHLNVCAGASPAAAHLDRHTSIFISQPVLPRSRLEIVPGC